MPHGITQGSLAWRRGAAAVVDLVFPPRCVACWTPLAVSVPPLLCCTCTDTLFEDAVQRCSRCAAASEFQPDGPNCVHCHSRPLHFDQAVTLGSYDAALREAVLRIKRPRDEPLAVALAELVWQRHGPQFLEWNIDLVTPVPMHWRRRWSRGANSPHVLAEALAQRLGVSCVARGLRRRRFTQVQAHLEREDRQRNVRGAFALGGGHIWAGRRVLLVDDILTTGATCSEAARMLKRAGADWVAAAIVARAQNPLG